MNKPEAQAKRAFLISLGQQVKRARRAAGMTQNTLAKRIGVGRAQIVRIEKGEVDLPARRLVALALALSKRLDYFIEPYTPGNSGPLTSEEKQELERTLRRLLGKPE